MARAIRGYKNQKRIMKKEYIKPEIVVEEFVSEIYMQSTSDDEIGQKPGEGIPLSNDRRGEWGNLWD